MKRDPTIQRLIRGDLLARSPLGYEQGREEMLETLLDLLPSYTQRDPRDPGVALLEAFAAVLEIFGFYHDRILTESKIGAAQLLQSVALLGDVVGYTPRPTIASVARQFFEARTTGLVPAGSKLAARLTDVPGKVVFETLRALSLGPAFNRMAFEPIIARHVGATRAVLQRSAGVTTEHLTPIDEFVAGDLAMFNGITGLELVPVAAARSRAIAVGHPLRRSYSVLDARIHCASEYRHLRNGHPLGEHDDLFVFEVSDRPILHIPDPSSPRRLRSTLELYVLDPGADPGNPRTWVAERRWEEVPDFTASEAADHHYRTFVDDRLRTYVVLRRRLGYRTLLRDDELDHVFVRFTPAVGDILPHKNGDGRPDLAGFVVELNQEYFTNPIVLPKVDGELVKTLPSDWVVTERSLDLLPGRQIIIENADTREKFVRTLGPRTLEQYLSWRHDRDDTLEYVKIVEPPPRPLWARIHADVLAPALGNGLLRRFFRGIFLQSFGHYFPLDLAPKDPTSEKVVYPVLPGRGVLPSIVDELLFIETIPERHDVIEGWSEASSLSISPLRNAAKAGPFHLWDQFYRQFENLDWALEWPPGYDANTALAEQGPDPEEDEEEQADEQGEEQLPPYPGAHHWTDELMAKGLAEMTIVPRGSTFIIVQDTSLIRPGDFFLLGKRVRYNCKLGELEDLNLDYGGGDERMHPLENVVLSLPLVDEDESEDTPRSSLDPRWLVAEVLQAVEVHGKIVRLKWPTQNEYKVDFLLTTQVVEGEPWVADDKRIEQPVTELVIVPQVASVFFGERFRQRVTLRPNQYLLKKAGALLPQGVSLIRLASRLSGKRLRERTSWPDLDDAAPQDVVNLLNATWDDIFLANIVEPAPLVVVEQPPAPMALWWRFLVRVANFAKLKAEDIVGILVGLPGYTALDELHKLTSVDHHNDTPTGFAFSADAADVHAAYSDPAIAGALEQTEHWAMTDPAVFVWNGLAILNWAPVQKKLTLGTLPGYDLDALLAVGAILNFGNDRFARVTGSQAGALDFEMLGGATPPAVLLVVRLYAVPATPVAPLAVAYLMLYGLVVLPLPVFLPQPLVDGGGEPADYLAGARYPQTHAESGTLFIESYRVDLHHEDFIAAAHGDGEPAYYWYTNKRDSLDKPRYLADNRHNFLRRRSVRAFMTIPTPDLKPGPFLLFSIKDGLRKDAGEAGLIETEPYDVWQVLTESIVFNSGNFIPVRLGQADIDHKIVANSMAIWIPSGEGMRRVEYAEDMLTLLEDLMKDDEDGDGVELLEEFRFTFNKTPEGTFTLNFMLLGAFQQQMKVGIDIFIDVFYTAEPYPLREGEDPYLHRADYPVCKGEAGVRWTEWRFYEFETRPLPWNPLRQLVILNSGDLKAGDYLFIDPSGVEQETETACAHPQPLEEEGGSESQRSRDYIQWTRVVEVDGRMVMVDPPVKIQPRGFYHYRVSGYRRPATAAVPDPDYYTLLQSEDKPQVEPDLVRELSFGNRLMLRPFAEIGGVHGQLEPVERRWLLDHLVPGDRLLVWDERWRAAWHEHRVADATAEPYWYDWPDRQHEVVIKRIVPRLGLVELEKRMPARFGVEYPGELVTAGDATFVSVESFRALPFYREPFQGPRELVAIGDGDRRLKFARYFGTVGELGLASVALDRPGTLASNVEVLTLDASAGEWARWTEFRRIDDARPKDRAFVLGLALPAGDVPTGCPPLELDPGPATDEACCCPDKVEAAPERPDVVGPDLGLDDLHDVLALKTELSVSFGDGAQGQLLPNGTGNVFIRPVELGRWCVHFPGPRERRILAADPRCLPFRISPNIASSTNLHMLVEHGAHLQWEPRGGRDNWRSAIVVEVDLAKIQPELSAEQLDALEHELPHDKRLQLRGISDAESAEGHDGVIVRPVRPGVVELFLALKLDLAALLDVANHGLNALTGVVKVYEQPRTALWRLERSFYEEALADDPTQREGAGVVLLRETEGLTEGSLLGFNASGEPRDEVEVAEVAAVGHATYSAALARGLERRYDLGRSYLFGNLVEIVQGDSERHVIGSGDGATRNLRLPLGNREPILYFTADPRAPGGLEPGVVVLVDDVPWERVGTLEGRGPRERVYRFEVEASGKCYVRFGDGEAGAIPAAGLDNIVAVMRLGDGARGNVPAGAVDRLLDGNLAVERTRNITPGVGGKAADDAAQAREHLMTRDFTHGQVITHDDVVRALRALSNVVHARTDPTAGPGAIRVWVALADRQPVTPDTLAELARRVAGAMPLAAGVALEIAGAEHVGVHVVLEVSINPGFFESDVIKGLEQAFLAADTGFFAPLRWPIGAPLRVGDIYEQAFGHPGVATARVRWLSREVEPMELPVRVPDVLWLAPHEVVRCDGDRAAAARRLGGSFRVEIKRGGK